MLAWMLVQPARIGWCFVESASLTLGRKGYALVKLVVAGVAMLRLVRLGEARVERRGFDLWVKG